MSIKKINIISYILRLMVVYFIISILNLSYMDRNSFVLADTDLQEGTNHTNKVSSENKKSLDQKQPVSPPEETPASDIQENTQKPLDQDLSSLENESKVVQPSSCILNRVDLAVDTRTDKDWIIRFLQLNINGTFHTVDIPRLEDKLLTTQVFYGAKIHMEYQVQGSNSDLKLNQENKSPDTNQDNPSVYCNMFIELQEKWTLIPVIRGSMGGGTPLLVYGVYDTHSFGQYLTLGGEIHTYGSADPGGVLWMKYPKWLDGNYTLNLQLWKQNLDSTSFDTDRNEIGSLQTQWSGARAMFLLPIVKSSSNSVFQTGFDYFIKQYKKQQYSPNLDHPDYYLDRYVSLYTGSTTSSNLRLKLLYDNVSINTNLFDGLRVDTSLGGLFDGLIDKNSGLNFDTEVYYYKLFGNEFNFASHLKLGFTKSKYIANMTNLGGFDSIRGYKDGFMYGNKYGYLNLEIRKIFLKTEWIHLQGVVFSDMGTASLHTSNLISNFEYSYGLGLKILVPSIYRMIFRFDYAIGRKGNHGLAIGTADFFDAYRPL